MSGVVQGVGFRPFVYRLAKNIGISGYVRNIGGQVEIVIDHDKKEIFLTKLKDEAPLHAHIEHIKLTPYKNAKSLKDFRILPSQEKFIRFKNTLPRDISICQDCLEEMGNFTCRHYRYAFTTCTNCGPRYSMIDSLPYDRTRTSMRDFKMCPQCQSEYNNPQNRRFHAQSISCPKCLVSLSFYHKNQKLVPIGDKSIESHNEEMLKICIQAIEKGEIIAIKGVGGFSIVCDGRNDESILRLRQGKNRYKKPFALMVRDVKMALKIADLNPNELQALKSFVAPIILANKSPRPQLSISDYIAPNIDTIGLILPYSGLHHLLLEALEFPIVFTSANLNGDPIISDIREIEEKIDHIIDGVLDYNRAIINPIDDSIMRFLAGSMRTIRLGRGLAPLSLSLLHGIPNDLQENTQEIIVAMGAEEKANLSYGKRIMGKKLQNCGGNFLISPYIGDLKTLSTIERYEKVLSFFDRIYPAKTKIFVSDSHPSYQSSILSAKKSLKFQCKHYKIQHHQAHFYAGFAEAMLQNPVLSPKDKMLGIIWDGTGLGDDGKIWGGEVFLGNLYEVERLGHFREFSLLGTEMAIKKIVRIGYALALECGANKLAQKEEEKLAQEGLIIKKMFEKKINTIKTTSVGRLFDGIASLCGILEKSSYEGEAGMLIEKFARKAKITGLIKDGEAYDFILESHKNKDLQTKVKKEFKNLEKRFQIDFSPMILQIENDLLDESRNISYSEKNISIVSAKFIHTLAKITFAISKNFSNIPVIFSGGVFQNRLLCEEIKRIFDAKNITFYMHRFTPPNDGCISFGQAIASVYKGWENKIDEQILN